MSERARPVLHLSLAGGAEHSGEITLSELAKVAQNTQRVISRLTESLVDELAPSEFHREISEAAELSLIGLRKGSTVLDIAGPELSSEPMQMEVIPVGFRDMAIVVFVDTLEALSEEHSILPIGVDESVARSIDQWLRALRHYDHITIEAEMFESDRRALIMPGLARRNLRSAQTQPSLPYISPDNRALMGVLYGLNLNAGKFAIEDDSGHSIPLSIPSDMREEAAYLTNMRVKAIGRISLDDERRRILSFEVISLVAPPSAELTSTFFEPHPLTMPPGTISQDDLSQGVISDLSEDEIDAFADALRSE